MNQIEERLCDKLTQVQSEFERQLQAFFMQQQERYGYGEPFEPLFLDATEFIARKGKRVRPLLFLSAYEMFGGERTPGAEQAAFRAAIALELFHSFILVHDDIIDRSERRRGLPTFHKQVESRLGSLRDRARLGESVALVMGDILFALATETLLEADFEPTRSRSAVKQFLSYVADTGAGEVQDILLATRDIAEVTIGEIERMYAHKTTRYTVECPLVLGAILSGAPQGTIHLLRQFAEPVGLAFQIQNDLLEFKHFDPRDAMFQSDIVEGKKTLLVREAYERLNDTDRSFLQLCLSSGIAGEPGVYKVRELIRKSGAEEELRKLVAELFAKSSAVISGPEFTDVQREGLLSLVRYIQQQTAASS